MCVCVFRAEGPGQLQHQHENNTHQQLWLRCCIEMFWLRSDVAQNLVHEGHTHTQMHEKKIMNGVLKHIGCMHSIYCTYRHRDECWWMGCVAALVWGKLCLKFCCCLSNCEKKNVALQDFTRYKPRWYKQEMHKLAHLTTLWPQNKCPQKKTKIETGSSVCKIRKIRSNYFYCIFITSFTLTRSPMFSQIDAL